MSKSLQIADIIKCIVSGGNATVLPRIMRRVCWFLGGELKVEMKHKYECTEATVFIQAFHMQCTAGRNKHLTKHTCRVLCLWFTLTCSEWKRFLVTINKWQRFCEDAVANVQWRRPAKLCRVEITSVWKKRNDNAVPQENYKTRS